jgi:hypothetical protein
MISGASDLRPLQQMYRVGSGPGEGHLIGLGVSSGNSANGGEDCPMRNIVALDGGRIRVTTLRAMESRFSDI